jgi:imidazolonepropionase
VKLIGPFKQIVTLNNLPLRGKISDEQLEIIENGGILINNENRIEEVGSYDVIANKVKQALQLSNSPILHLGCSFRICRLPHSYLLWRKPS